MASSPQQSLLDRQPALTKVPRMAEEPDQVPGDSGTQDGPRPDSVFVERLRRIVDGVGRAAFVQRANVNERTLTRYLTGRSEPGLGQLVRLAQAGDVSVDWLCGVAADDAKVPDSDQVVVAVDPELEEVMASDEPLEEDTVRKFLEWSPRVLLGVMSVAPGSRLVSESQGHRIGQQFLARIAAELPELVKEWDEIFGKAVKESRKRGHIPKSK